MLVNQLVTFAAFPAATLQNKIKKKIRIIDIIFLSLLSAPWETRSLPLTYDTLFLREAAGERRVTDHLAATNRCYSPPGLQVIKKKSMG